MKKIICLFMLLCLLGCSEQQNNVNQEQEIKDTTVTTVTTTSKVEDAIANVTLDYEEEMFKEHPSITSYYINNFESEHFREVANKVVDEYWKFYLDKKNPDWVNYSYTKKSWIIETNFNKIFCVVRYKTLDNKYAQYYTFGILYDDEVQKYVVRELRERDSETIRPVLLNMLDEEKDTIQFNLNLDNYEQDERGVYAEKIAITELRAIKPTDSVDDLIALGEAFGKEEAKTVYDAVQYGYYDIDSLAFYYENELSILKVWVSTFDTTKCYYVAIDEGEMPSYMMARFGEPVPDDGDEWVLQWEDGTTRYRREGNRIYAFRD